MNCSLPINTLKSWQQPGLVTRSPFATATRRPDGPRRARPARVAASVSMKLCGSRVEQRDEEGDGYVHVDVHSPPSTRLDLGEGVDGDGWLAFDGSPTHSSSNTTSMLKRRLQCSLCPWTKNSSQWKHLPSLRHWVTSVGDRRIVVDGLLMEVDDVAGPEAAGSSAEAGAYRYEDSGVDRAVVDGMSREILRCS
jgi:hypothetical protein